MTDRPLIIFPRPTTVPRTKRKRGFPKKPKEPSAVFVLEPQVQRLGPKFERLAAQLLELQNHPHGIIPEQVLVLEIRDSGQDFKSALKKKGIEWLAEEEMDDEILGEDDDDSENQPHAVRKLYLRMTDQQAMKQLLSLWEKFRKGKSLLRGSWRELFQHLYDLRKWEVKDRLVLEDWQARLKQGETTPVRFEAELWFAQEIEKRQQNASSLQQLIEEQGGKVVTQTLMPDIAYHALLGELPLPVIQTIIGKVNHTVKLFCCEQVMFFRPVGQCMVRIPEGEEVVNGRISQESTLPLSSKTPVVALLDGLPLENHQMLRGRLIVDDWATDYPAQSRFHGTAMASLIIHGDLETPDVPLPRPIYVRPILKPTGWGNHIQEAIPENLLPVDLVHRTVRRLFEGEGTEPPVAPEVRIINLSICDSSRLFHHRLSPWAQLLDWLACKYQVLFLVSAGNHTKDLTLDMPRQSFSFDEIETQTLRSVAKDTRHRRLLSPSESINALTVGAIHQDNCQGQIRGRDLVDPYLTKGLPSPINAHGLGYRRAVKPDILLAGGRQLFAEKLGNTHQQATLVIRNLTSPPGQKVAVPSKQPGVLNGTAYTRGTSNAAALATRVAAQCYELLEELRSTHQPNGELLEKQYDAVLLKALLVHGADWGSVYPILAETLKEEVTQRQLREYMSRFLGYGAVNTQTVFSCTEQRATLLGCGTLREDEAQVYQVPLPFSLSGPKVKRRLTITLAWISPINPSHEKYRRAHLWFEPPKQPLLVERKQADYRATQRGTVQHEILEGDKAVAFEDNQQLAVQVNCKADAGKLDEPVRYALVVTLAVAEGINLPIYEEIRTRILQAQLVKIKV